MKSPGITTMIKGKNKTLYMQTVKSIEEKTRENLKKTLGGSLLYLLRCFLKETLGIGKLMHARSLLRKNFHILLSYKNIL